MRIFLLLLISFAVNLSAQSYLSSEYNLIKASPISSTGKIGIESWFSGGSGVTDAGSLAASFNNPAALQLQSLSFSVEGTYREGIDWIADYRYDGQFHPSFVSIGMPLNDMNISLSYIRQYSQKLKSPVYQITTVEHPEGTGETFSASTNNTMHAIIATAQYKIPKLFSLGASIGVNYFYGKDELWHSWFIHDGYGILTILGIHAELEEDVSIGAAFRYSTPLNSLKEKKDNLSLIIYDRGSNSTYIPVVYSPKYVARLPWSFESGLKWKVSPDVDLMFSYEFQNWNFVSNTFKNISVIHIGGSFHASENVMLRAGFFTQDDPETPSTNQKFLTGGIIYDIPPVGISLGILDSHIFKGDNLYPTFGTEPKQFHQTIISSSMWIFF